jgi:hypothetical protein
LTAKVGLLRLRLNNFFLKALGLGGQTKVLSVGRSQIIDAECTDVLGAAIVEGRQDIRIALRDARGTWTHYESTADSDDLGTIVAPLGTGGRTGFFRYTLRIKMGVGRRTGSSSFWYDNFRKMVFEAQT